MEDRFHLLYTTTIVNDRHIRHIYIRTAVMRRRIVYGGGTPLILPGHIMHPTVANRFMHIFIQHYKIIMSTTAQTQRLTNFSTTTGNPTLHPAQWIAIVKDRRLSIKHLLNLIQGNDHTITARRTILIIHYKTSISYLHIFKSTMIGKVSPARLGNHRSAPPLFHAISQLGPFSIFSIDF